MKQKLLLMYPICDIYIYKTRLDDVLSHILLCDSMFDCDDQCCSVQKDEIVIYIIGL